jgi:hypothetical protein
MTALSGGCMLEIGLATTKSQGKEETTLRRFVCVGSNMVKWLQCRVLIWVVTGNWRLLSWVLTGRVRISIQVCLDPKPIFLPWRNSGSGGTVCSSLRPHLYLCLVSRHLGWWGCRSQWGMLQSWRRRLLPSITSPVGIWSGWSISQKGKAVPSRQWWPHPTTLSPFPWGDVLGWGPCVGVVHGMVHTLDVGLSTKAVAISGVSFPGRRNLSNWGTRASQARELLACSWVWCFGLFWLLVQDRLNLSLTLRVRTTQEELRIGTEWGLRWVQKVLGVESVEAGKEWGRRGKKSSA